MTVYQAQPNRVFPCLRSFKKDNTHHIGYEFSAPIKFYNKKDHDFLYDKKIVKYFYQQSIPRFVEGKEYNPLFIRLKEQQEIAPCTRIDYVQGIFEKSYFKKEKNDFAFTIIDHPINQFLNIYVYTKHNINTVEEVEKFNHVLKMSESEYSNFIKSNGFNLPDDYSNFKRGEDLLCYDYVYSMNIFLKDNDIKNFIEYQNNNFTCMLICSCSLKDINCLEDWVDYYLSNPNLQNILKFMNINMTFINEFFHCSEMGDHIDFYGIMENSDVLNKSLFKLNSICPEMRFDLKSEYKQHNYLDWKYRRKELNALFEKDINFYEKQKQIILNS